MYLFNILRSSNCAERLAFFPPPLCLRSQPYLLLLLDFLDLALTDAGEVDSKEVLVDLLLFLSFFFFLFSSSLLLLSSSLLLLSSSLLLLSSSSLLLLFSSSLLFSSFLFLSFLLSRLEEEEQEEEGADLLVLSLDLLLLPLLIFLRLGLS